MGCDVHPPLLTLLPYAVITSRGGGGTQVDGGGYTSRGGYTCK